MELTNEQVLATIDDAIQKSSPFSLVRVGDGENIVLAQKSVWTLDRIYKEVWAKQALKGKKGITIPDISLRDHMVKAIKSASIVGVLPENDQRINAPNYLKRPLTNSVFNHFQITPKATCDAALMRDLSTKKEFWKIFRNKRVLILYKHAGRLTTVLVKNYGLNVKMAIPFEHHAQLESTLKKIEKSQHKFDIALLSCGVNSVVLAYEIMRRTGKVAIDFGKPANRMVNNDVKMQRGE